ncbi:ABC transporter ATP-binding protein [Paenibacillus sp. JTLBN-2024]
MKRPKRCLGPRDWKENAAPPLHAEPRGKKLLSIIGQFVHPKALYILDEPTSGIDFGAAERVLRLCREKTAAGAAVLMITHDPDLAEREASFMLRLSPHQAADFRRLGPA